MPHSLCKPTVLACLLLIQGSVYADTAAQPIRALTPFELEQEKLKQQIADQPPAYVDKVMDDSELAALPASPALSTSSTGFQAYALEGRYEYEHHSQRSDSPSRLHAGRYGLRTEYRLGTLNFGNLLLQGDFRASTSSQPDPGLGWYSSTTQLHGRRLTLRNDGLPLTSHTFADLAAGDIYSDLTDALRRSYRLSLGSSVVRGGSARIHNRHLDLRLGSGRRGTLTGGPYPGYESLPGKLDWAGVTLKLPHGAYLGVQTNRARSIPLYVWNSDPTLYPSVSSTTAHITSTALTAGFGSEHGLNSPFSARLLHIRSRTQMANNMPDAHARGNFLEGSLRHKKFVHHAGIYQTDPQLSFGDQPLPSDNRGIYWHSNYQGTRWNWGLGTDLEQNNPQRDPDRPHGRHISISSHVSGRINNATSIGGNAVWGHYRNTFTLSGTSWEAGYRSLYASAWLARQFPSWGHSRLLLSQQRNNPIVANAPPATGWDIQWEHDWITQKYETMRPELVTTLGWASDRSAGMRQTYPTAGLRFRYWPHARWNLGGNLSYASRSANLYSTRGLSGSLHVEGDLGRGWRAGASASANQTKMHHSPILASGFTPLSTRTNDKYVSIYLRWEGSHGGSGYALAGQRSAGAAGAGSIEGVVYYDANRDGIQQAHEAGIPSVEVILDDGYRTTTDDTGRYRFALVPSGAHQVSVNLDTVPLPWGTPPASSSRSVDVGLRQTSHLPLGLVRTSE